MNMNKWFLLVHTSCLVFVWMIFFLKQILNVETSWFSCWDPMQRCWLLTGGFNVAAAKFIGSGACKFLGESFSGWRFPMCFIFTLFGEMILFDDKLKPPTSFEYQLEWIFTKCSASFIKTLDVPLLSGNSWR